MSQPTLIKTRLAAGRYEGLLNVSGTPPVIEAVHHDRVIGIAEAVDFKGRPGHFLVSFDIPAEVINDGVQTIRLRSAASGETLDRITILSGEPLEDDIRTEVEFLREELDLLKRSFRRHCVETGAD